MEIAWSWGRCGEDGLLGRGHSLCKGRASSGEEEEANSQGIPENEAGESGRGPD